MSASKEPPALANHTHDGEFLYTVLNLPATASPQEIRERYRTLSVVFHPDKQHDEATKDTAARRFLEIQRAYEVLSDPFLRHVYDIFGEEGLAAQWDPALRSLAHDDLHALLKRRKRDWTQEKLRALISPGGRLTCGINAASLFEEYMGHPADGWRQRLANRASDVRMTSLGVLHGVEKTLGEKTTVKLAARAGRQGRRASSNLSGTVRHQFSPRWALEGTGLLLDPRALVLKATYADDDSRLSIRSVFSPALLRGAPPPLTVSLQRRLFPTSLTQGVLAFDLSNVPSASFSIVAPKIFNLLDELPPQKNGRGAGLLRSVSGLSLGSYSWNCGLVIDERLATLTWGCTAAITELQLQAQAGWELGHGGLAWLLACTWAGETSQVGASLSLGGGGVAVILHLEHLSQKVSVPITLAAERDWRLALWTAVVPATAAVLGYHFVVRPRRRRQRIAYIRAARRALAEDESGARREADATTALLRETAKKHMQAEAAKGGLVILEAKYGSIEAYGLIEGADELVVDVTVALQALVHNSQVHVPGHRSKAGIPGFCDPAPSDGKVLRVRYLFRGRAHYAEIGDGAPVVLPLAGHRVG